MFNIVHFTPIKLFFICVVLALVLLGCASEAFKQNVVTKNYYIKNGKLQYCYIKYLSMYINTLLYIRFGRC